VIVDSNYSDVEKSLTLTVEHTGETIIANRQVDLPTNSFLVFIDPGLGTTDKSISGSARAKVRLTSSKADCAGYGPGRDLDLYAPDDKDDKKNDFGDDNNLGKTPPSDPTDETLGLPTGVAPSYFSTNVFDWCLVPPTSGAPYLGLEVVGQKSLNARVSASLSPDAIDYIGSVSGSNIDAKDIGIYSETTQVSNEVTVDDDGRALASVIAPLVAQSTDITVIDEAETAGVQRVRAAADRENRIIIFGKEAEVAIVPSNGSNIVKGDDFSMDGSVDEDLVGETITLLRIDKSRDCAEISTRAVREVVIARDVVSDSATFSLKVPTSTLFPNGRSRTSVAARIGNDQERRSNEVSLSSRGRNGRR